MTHRTPPTMLFQGARYEQQEMQRRMRAMQDKRASLLTHRSDSEFEESTDPVIISDEGSLDDLADEHRRDSWVGERPDDPVRNLCSHGRGGVLDESVK
jgi:hypothetical protein